MRQRESTKSTQTASGLTPVLRHLAKQSTKRLNAITAAWAFAAALLPVGPAGALAEIARADSTPTPATQDPGDPLTTAIAGGELVSTSRTVAHWYDTFTDPTIGTTYGANVVGADPRQPGVGTTTIPTEIVALNFTFEPTGQSFNASDVVDATVNSPIFQPTDWTAFSNNPHEQYLDAVIRSEFNQVGPSPYHLILAQPKIISVHIDVPAPQGSIRISRTGHPYGCVDGRFTLNTMWNLIGSLHIDPTSLPIFLSNEVYPSCRRPIIAFHGFGPPPITALDNPDITSVEGQGQQSVQTWVWSQYLQPWQYGPREPGTKDVNVLGHELSEWANDPFVSNTVQPYAFPYPASTIYGPCGNYLESGDPLVLTSDSIPGNTYFQTGINAPYADGSFHIQDEAFIPWFARESPNVTSEPEASSGHGRYSFFGDLNTDPAWHQPATRGAC